MKKMLSITLIFALCISILAGCSKGTNQEVLHVQRKDWAKEVKTAINDFVDMYGKNSENYSPDSYVVSDFDNTMSILDIQEQLIAYQLLTMSFAITPDNISDILSTEIGDKAINRACLSKDGIEHSYDDWIADITTAYDYLYTNFGPFTPQGLSAQKQEEIQKEPYWNEFAAKMRALYDVIYDSEDPSVAYPWVLYWFTGMTDKEVYDLAKASHTKYKAVDTTIEKFVSPSNIKSNVGQVEIEWTSGIQVTENIKEMVKVISQNGIDYWICSASNMEVVKAAVDVFDLHDYISGVTAMAIKKVDGKFTNEYDYKNSCSVIAKDNGIWEDSGYKITAQTYGEGKNEVILKAIAPMYNGATPLAGFCDSTGDYNFCTEFASLKLVVCLNRASRKVTDGGGVISEVAVYEKEHLGYDLKKANEAGDTLYVLQGRDENGKRTIINSNETILLSATVTKLFANDSNASQYNYFVAHNMSVADIINTFAIITEANDPNNLLGFKYGFLTEYEGYHSK